MTAKPFFGGPLKRLANVPATGYNPRHDNSRPRGDLANRLAATLKKPAKRLEPA
jgi:hypothetical protein